MPFNRELPPQFIEMLWEATKRKSGWWVDVLADPSLFVAMRASYLDVYYMGMALLRVAAPPAGLTLTTHVKFLMNPDAQFAIGLTPADGFDLARLLNEGLTTSYNGPITLDRIKRMAKTFSDDERRGCHKIAIRNRNVIDCEIYFPGHALDAQGQPENYGKADIACLEQGTEPTTVSLVFWEAKCNRNNALRSTPGAIPEVAHQIQRYRNYLSNDHHRNCVIRSYIGVCKNLVEIEGMRNLVRSSRPDIAPPGPISELVIDVADGKRTLNLAMEQSITPGHEIALLQPKVGLVVFDYDAAHVAHRPWQERNSRWRRYIPSWVMNGTPNQVQL